MTVAGSDLPHSTKLRWKGEQEEKSGRVVLGYRLALFLLLEFNYINKNVIFEQVSSSTNVDPSAFAEVSRIALTLTEVEIMGTVNLYETHHINQLLH